MVHADDGRSVRGEAGGVANLTQSGPGGSMSCGKELCRNETTARWERYPSFGPQ